MGIYTSYINIICGYVYTHISIYIVYITIYIIYKNMCLCIDLHMKI